ncbi:MAG: hypothetical protein HY899_01900 [Deltaproteobacteria bacterium]|nr:hypothetical protein [Deltaproteobacteria bacterium]
MLRNTGGARDRFVWKWKKGGATAAGDLGDPTSTADYAVCLYDKVPAGMRPVLEKHARASDVCNGLPCWSAAAAGYKYRDSKSERGAIRNLTIKAGEAGRSSLSVRAVGPTLSLPVLPLAKNPSVTAQLINLENGKCWEATFSTVLSSDTARFKARSD